MPDKPAQDVTPEQSDAAKATDAKLMQPVFTDEEKVRQKEAADREQAAREATPAPAGGAEGSNFNGGVGGKEKPGLTGREDYRGNHPDNKDMTSTNKASDSRNTTQGMNKPTKQPANQPKAEEPATPSAAVKAEDEK